jgi:hypothetical protein
LLRFYRLLWIALSIFTATPAFAQFTRDTAANKKIDEAINTHYVATDFEKAEGVLLGTINACGDKCSPATLGKAWMYIGIVRGSGKNNQAGAKDAFQKALAADPSTKLDTVLATPETQATFAAAGGTGSASAPDPAPVSTPDPVAAGPVPGGGLTCTPAVTSVETRRPIPVQCSSDEEVTAMEIKYKPFGSDTWKTLAMQKKGTSFRAQIPCGATGTAGTFRLYVRAKDPQGEQIDSWGTKQEPIVINLAESGVDEEPPSFDDGEAPARCATKEECPPDFPGCGGEKKAGARGGADWGASCANSTECKAGLLCEEGTCQAAPSCESDADCTTGVCTDGKCDIVSEAVPGAPGALKKNWLGLNVAQDFAFVGGYNVCDPKVGEPNDNFACFYEGTTDEPFFHTPYPLRDGINTGTVLATTRILVSYDRAFTPNITVGARLGFAFRGGPPAGQTPKGNVTNPAAHAKGEGGTPFLPLHAEIRGQYWFLPLTAKLFRAYGVIGGGLAQVDAKVVINQYDCADAGYLPNGDPNPAEPWGVPAPGMNPPYMETPEGTGRSPYHQCRLGEPSFYSIKNHKPVPVDGWKKMGQGFVQLGVGGMLAFNPKMGLTLEAKLLYMLPATGVVIQPALGFAYGF